MSNSDCPVPGDPDGPAAKNNAGCIRWSTRCGRSSSSSTNRVPARHHMNRLDRRCSTNHSVRSADQETTDWHMSSAGLPTSVPKSCISHHGLKMPTNSPARMLIAWCVRSGSSVPTGSRRMAARNPRPQRITGYVRSPGKWHGGTTVPRHHKRRRRGIGRPSRLRVTTAAGITWHCLRRSVSVQPLIPAWPTGLPNWESTRLGNCWN